MRKFMIKLAAASFVAAVSVPVMAAPSGVSSGVTSGSSGVSGSAGLGIDYGALVVAGGTGNPGITSGSMGGPIAGLAKHFAKPSQKK